MDPDSTYRFGHYELQPRERRLLRQQIPVPLPGKAFDLLTCLIAHAPRLLKKEELFERVWAGTVVEESNLNYTMSILRKALLDGQDGVRMIETVPRQGYRFVAPVERGTGATVVPAEAAPGDRQQIRLVQREPELEALKSAFDRACVGRRQVVFITGEAGIGKTSLVDRFVNDIRLSSRVSIARGQCIEHRGEAEAYMPMLEALGRLGRQREGAPLVEALARFAPSWVVQLPALFSTDDLASAERRLHGQTRERMLREMDEALAVATVATPLVLVLEDLHWSDVSTIDLLGRLARSSDPARLLVAGTYRSADAVAASHPVHATARELQLRGSCHQIPLAALSSSSVATYLDERFAGAVPASVVDLIHRRTEGNPLFVAALVESWLASGILAQTDGRWSWRSEVVEQTLEAPESLRAFLEEQIRQLPTAEREVLEAAAIAGTPFSSAVASAALEASPDAVEASCGNLARVGRFIRTAGEIEYPDGTASDQYEFVHAFYVDVLYSLVPTGRRVRLHQQIALAIEGLYGDRAPEVATRLATHFVNARDARKAVRYLSLASRQSLARSAPREAIAGLEEALKMLSRIPDLDERHEAELAVQSMLATALTATRGFSDAAAEAAYRRAYELAKGLDTPRLFPIAFGLATMLELRGQYQDSQSLMEQHMPAQQACGGYVTEARDLLACSAFHQGLFDQALEHALKGLEAAQADDAQSPLNGCYGEHPGVGCHTWAALSLWFLGRPEEALEHARRAVAMAEEPGHLYSLANARAQLATLHQLRGDAAEAAHWAVLTIDLGERQGFAHRVATGQVLHGWAIGARGLVKEGIAELERGLSGVERIGMQLDRPYFLALLAEMLLADRQFDRALATLDAAQRQASNSRSFFYQSELWRLRGSVLLAAHGTQCAKEADECLARAVEIAREQRARGVLARIEAT
jgi:DNA-binding winged helix-turn-helix (wHTH) protein/tetratricopeptide (TPR) repeat protein